MNETVVGLCAGATKLINHFLINDSWFLVDLPGYGWVCARDSLVLLCSVQLMASWNGCRGAGFPRLPARQLGMSG